MSVFANLHKIMSRSKRRRLDWGEGEEAAQNWEETEKEVDFHEDSRKEEVRVTEHSPTLEDSAMQVSAMLRSDYNIYGLTTIEDAVPLNQHNPGEGEVRILIFLYGFIRTLSNLPKNLVSTSRGAKRN